jgi:ELWxxDGT repeat protein
VVIGADVYLAGWTQATGTELFRVRIGQAPELVADIHPGPIGSKLLLGAAVGSTLFFAADDGVNGFELWKTDGTAGGTTLVHDLEPGSGGAFIERITAFAGGVVYVAKTNGVARELWWSDGTPTGLVQITNLTVPNFTSIFTEMHVSGNLLFFAAVEHTVGMEIFVTDGSPASVTLLADMAPGIKNADPFQYIDYGGLTYVTIKSTHTQNTELWKTDGTPAGTSLVMELGPAILPPNWTVGEMIEVGGKLVFSAMTDALGGELWISDGTPAGTQVLTDFNAPGITPTPFRLTAYNQTVLFSFPANPVGTEAELWSTGLTPGTAQMIANLYPTAASFPDSFTLFGGRAFFTAQTGIGLSGRELWSTDGTTAGTRLEFDVNPGGANGDPEDLTVTPNGLLFAGQRPDVGRELWQWQSGVGSLYADLQPGDSTGDSNPHNLARAFARDLYWAADDGMLGVEPYRSHDATDAQLWAYKNASAALHADVFFGAPSSNPTELTAFDGALYFVANAPFGARELWRTTASGFESVPNAPVMQNPDSLTVAGQRLFFVAVNAQGVRNVFSTDGTTTLQHTQLSDPALQPFGLTQVGNRLAFMLPLNSSGAVAVGVLNPANGQMSSFVGSQPITVDPQASGITAAAPNQRLTFVGTHPTLHRVLLNVNLDNGLATVLFAPDAGAPMATFGTMRELTWAGDVLYFVGGGATGDELYRATTTSGSGALVFDPTPTAGVPSLPRNLNALGDTLRFSIQNSANPNWLGSILETDGGPVQVAVNLLSEANGGGGPAQHGDPAEFLNVGDDFVYVATLKSGAGRELYVDANPGALVVDYGQPGTAGLLTASTPHLGQNVVFELAAIDQQAATYLLYSAWPAAPILGISAPADPLWLKPSGIQLIGAGPLGNLFASVPLAATPSLSGVHLAVQAISITPQGFVRASNAKALTLGL